MDDSRKYRKDVERAYRSNRLRDFYASGNFKSKTEFAELLDIKKQNMNAYFNGDQDPANLCDELIELGCDIHWLITGMRYDEEKTGISNNDIRMLIELRLHGIETPEAVKRLIELHDSTKRILQQEARAEPQEPVSMELKMLPNEPVDIDNIDITILPKGQKKKGRKEHHK